MSGLGFGAVALLVFLAGTAGAEVVAAYFFACDARAAAVACGAGTGGACLLEFALLLLLELALKSVDGCGWGAGGDWDRCVLPGSGWISLDGRLSCCA